MSGQVHQVAKIDEETSGLGDYVSGTVEGGVRIDALIGNVVVKQENEAIKLQYACEKIEFLAKRLDGFMGNTSDLGRFYDENNED